MKFSVDFQNVDDLQGVDLAAALKPVSYSWAALGGPEEALIAGEVGAHILGALLRLLGREVRIWDDYGMLVWWGIVTWVEMGAVRYSLDEMANRVRVRYQDGMTDWAEEAESVRRYGIKERIFTALTNSQAVSEQLRDTLLKASAYPQGSPLPGEGASAAGEDNPRRMVQVQVGCRGWWHTLDWLFASSPLRVAAASGMSPNAWRSFGAGSSEYRVAQMVTIPAGEIWTLRGIRCTLRTSGKPGDRIYVRLCEDAGGIPGGALASGWISGDSLSNAGGSVLIDLRKPLTLSAGAYWVVWNRSGAMLAGDAYALGYSSTSGTFLLYQNGAWSSQSGTIHAELLGGEHLETSELIERTAGDTGQFLADVQLVGLRSPATALPAMPAVDEYEDGSRTGLAVLEALLAYGTLEGKRLLARVTPRRVLRIYTAPDVEEDCLQKDVDGGLYDGEMSLRPGNLASMVGRWMLPVDPCGAGVDPVFIEGARLDVRRMKLHFTWRTNRDELMDWLVHKAWQG